MSIRITTDANQPSASIEIPLGKPLTAYDLEQVEQPTPRDIDVILVSQGFRDLVDDARGILMDLLAHPPRSARGAELDFTHEGPTMELTQLTGAICPGDDEVYPPGLWIVLRDPHAKPKTAPSAAKQRSIAGIAAESGREVQLG